MQRNLCVFGVVCLTACTEYELEPGGPGGPGNSDAAEPLIAVSPEIIEFDTVDIVNGDGPITEQVEVTNVGGATLRIEDLYLEAGQASFSFSSVSSVSLEPGATAVFNVTFDPKQPYTIADAVIVDSNAANGEAAVDLMGEALAPQIELTPEFTDFGANTVGCADPQTINIRNVGNAPLEILETPRLTASSADLWLHLGHDYVAEPKDTESFPQTVEPGGSVDVQVIYHPLDDIDDSSVLSVVSNDPFRDEARAEQIGTIVPPEEQVDLYEQPDQPKTDIVFVVDNSCSMGWAQESLSDNFATFMWGLSLTDADYQIGVILTDSPNFQGAIITPDTLNPVAEFTNQAVAGTGGSPTERGMQMLFECVLPGADCSPDSGFMRDDALFAGIFVSDEGAQGAVGAPGLAEYLWDLKDDEDLVRLHAIVGDVPGGCDTALPGFGYDTAVSLTGGNFLSICASDWGSHMSVLAEGSVQDLSRFLLTETPVEDTIEVFVDGKSMEKGWSYTGHEEDGGDNSVKFYEEYQPEGGSEIRIEYTVLADCDQ